MYRLEEELQIERMKNREISKSYTNYEIREIKEEDIDSTEQSLVT